MSSERHLARLLALALVLGGCADVRRGEYWREPEDEAGATSGDGDDDNDDGAPADGGTTAAGDDDGDDDGAGTAGSETTGGPSGPTFAHDVAQLLDAGCERCHGADGQASHTAFLLVGEIDTDYETTLEFVNTNDPEASRLLSKAAGSGHTGGVIFDDRSSEYETILAWIEEGARP